MTVECWSGNACRGYIIAAAQEAGLDSEQVMRLCDCLGDVMARMTIDEAAQHWYEYGFLII